jgi:hypothetical protein
MVGGQSWQKANETPISTNKLGVVAHAYHPSYTGGIDKRIIVQANPGKTRDPVLRK